MEQINKSIRSLFAWALASSVGFPLGVLGIVFGAVFWKIPLLVVGIVAAVAGFYGMPLLWVQYGKRRQDRTLWRIIQEDRLLTVGELCMQTGRTPDEIRERITRMIGTRELTGYLFREDTLEPLDPERRRAAPGAPTKKCPNCGATMVSDGSEFLCEYCGSREAE